MNWIAQALLWFAYLVSLYFGVFWFLVYLGGSSEKKAKRLRTFPDVTIIIPSYNEEKRVGGTIKSALKLDYPKDKLEIIVVNDGSTDNTKKLVENFIKSAKSNDIKLINQENKGKGAALNAGLKIAKGEFFVCLDADSYVRADALKKMLPRFGSDDRIAAVLPLLKVRKPTNFLQKMQWFEYIINMFYKELMGKLNCIHVAPGPFSVYRKKIIHELGGFDEYHNLTEDLEMALRLQHNHYKLIQVLDTEVTTIAPSSLKELYQQRNRWYKGAIFNAINYRRMLFNKKYGDFGFIQFPTIILSGIIALIILGNIVYYALKPYISYLLNMRFVNFDFLTFLMNLTVDIKVLDLNFMAIMVAFVMFFVSIFILRKSHVRTNEKLLKYGFLPLVSYFLIFFLVLGTMWVGIALDILIGKKQRW